MAGLFYLRLEARVQGGEERVVGRQRQDPLLGHGALDVVVLHYHVLLQDLNGEHLLRVALLGEHHLDGFERVENDGKMSNVKCDRCSSKKSIY